MKNIVIGHALWLLMLTLAPVIIWQGRSVKKNTIRLPEAKGDGCLSAEGELSLLHIGESTVAGVGVETLDQGLTGKLFPALSQAVSRSVSARAMGSNGARIDEINSWKADLPAPDILLITMGVNDTTGFTSLAQWRRQLRECVGHYADKNTQVFFTSVPRMQEFPALPKPLSWMLGLRAAQLNLSLKKLCAESNWQLIQADLPINPEWMAADGYHPNELGYEKWAGLIAEKVSAQYLK